MLALLLANSADEAVGGAVASGFGLLYCACWAVGILVAIATIVFWIMMLVDCVKRDESEFPNSTGNSKTIWLVVLIASWFLGSLYWLAAIIYYFMVKRAAQKPAEPPLPAA